MAAVTLFDDEPSAAEHYLASVLEEWLSESGGAVGPEEDAPASLSSSRQAAWRISVWPVSDEWPAVCEAPFELYEAEAADDGVHGIGQPEVEHHDAAHLDAAAAADDGAGEPDGDTAIADDGDPAQPDGAAKSNGDRHSMAGALGADAGSRAVSAGAVPAASVPADLVGELNGMLESVTLLAGADWHGLPGQGAHDALDALEQIDRRLAGVRAQVLMTVEANGLWALDGSRTFKSWLRQRTDTTAAAASRQVRHSRALRDHLPLTRTALEAGEISSEHVGVLVREAITSHQLRAQLGDAELGEAFLVEQAKALDAGMFTKLVRSWAIAADPEGADRAWREADAKEELTIAPTLGGYHVAGWLDEVSGQVVHAALRAHMGRKAQGDERTPGQRRAAALVALCHQSLDAGRQGTSARVRPHVTVTTSLQTLRALAAAMGSAIAPVMSNGEPVPAGAAFGISAQDTLEASGGPRDPAARATSTPSSPITPSTPSTKSAESAESATSTMAGDVGSVGAGDAGTLFTISADARRWVEDWKPGQDHVISAAIDHRAMVGIEPATLEDGTPIPPALLARLVCESGLSRVVFGAESTILDAGREKRIFPANQTKAIIARDRHCQFPGCDEPPGFGEIHHSIWWAKHHGPTDAEHGILVCWHHHDWIHAHGITITRSGGRWYFTDRHGWAITAKHPSDNDGDSAEAEEEHSPIS